jgi:hypothetical protein
VNVTAKGVAQANSFQRHVTGLPEWTGRVLFVAEQRKKLWRFVATESEMRLAVAARRVAVTFVRAEFGAE